MEKVLKELISFIFGNGFIQDAAKNYNMRTDAVWNPRACISMKIFYYVQYLHVHLDDKLIRSLVTKLISRYNPCKNYGTTIHSLCFNCAMDLTTILLQNTNHTGQPKTPWISPTSMITQWHSLLHDPAHALFTRGHDHRESGVNAKLFTWE